jgi:hypothetical protein
VQVFFVDKQTLKQIEKSDDHGNAIIKELKSENEARGINPTEIPSIKD